MMPSLRLTKNRWPASSCRIRSPVRYQLHVAGDRELDAVEIGPPALPVIRVAGQRDPLVRLKLDKSKGSGADGMLSHLGRSNMARIDHRITRSSWTFLPRTLS